MPKSRVKSITITRAEGLISECDRPITVPSFEAANVVLLGWSWSAPKEGGYDKCDFKIEWEDGETYDGRFDLQHPNVDGLPDLGKHVRSFVAYLCGEPPAWLQRPGKENYLRNYRREIESEPARTTAAIAFRAQHELGDLANVQ